MLHLLHRTSEAGITTLRECASAVLGLEQKAFGCYSEYISYDKHKLVEILLFDGFFILELFMRYLESDKSDDHVEVFKDISYDPIINNVWTVPTLQHDLALLENQIPFFILETLFDIIKKYAPKPLTCSFTRACVCPVFWSWRLQLVHAAKFDAVLSDACPLLLHCGSSRFVLCALLC
ncbi:UPF0481 protein [Camellia lanceoleosa]|uniref:UPF0481 protein n=1 Tax=Camellia lanceoleosa TaxID=1840588 RepID=A0ACC0G8H3_9ERIC|nr:UPF0481 protein [Camellia lanceoleosa]